MSWLKRGIQSPKRIWTRFHRRYTAPEDPYEVCPVCRHGKLSPMILMDTMACDFCRHIFSIDLSQPLVQPLTLRLEDVAQPMFWQWTGAKWKAVPRTDVSTLRWLWSLCLLIVVLPSLLMGGAVRLFPAEGKGAWIPFVWLGLTVVFHGVIALWLLAEHYQWPVYTRLKLAWARLSF